MSKRISNLFDMQFFTSSISTMLVLLLLGLIFFLVLSANQLSGYVRENIGISVLISDDMKKSEALSFQKKLNESPFVKESIYISKEDALKEQTATMGTDPTEFLGYNPFTASIEIKLNAEYAHSDSLRWIVDEIQMNKKVVEVNYPQNLLDAVNRNLQKISIFLLSLAALLTFISFALINNTIRLAMYSKRFLIHTMKLVGASWNFIRKPFIIRNFWIGVMAATMADMLLMGTAYWIVSYEPQLIEIITPSIMLQVTALIFLFGVLITCLCAYISINKYLRMKAGALYKI